jgi:chemotaxis protein methyltransferase CheR
VAWGRAPREGQLTEDDLDALSEAVRRQSGVILPPHNPVALTNLLSSVLRRFGLTDISALTAALRRDDEEISRAVAETLATSVSGFFRDPALFERFATQTLPRLLGDRAEARYLRIWCAACAAGQEAYSIAMLVAEARLKGVLEGWTIEIVATDFNTALVERAEAGLYSEAEMQGVSEERRATHFIPDGDDWRIRDAVRAMTGFRVFNLLDPCDGLGCFDAVFSRNVLIYFDAETAVAVLGRITKILAPGGVLMLGVGEGLRGFSGDLSAVAPGEYVRVAATEAGS